MSPVFVIFCIIAFLIPVSLCFYYKHKVEEQRVELNALKEKKEQTATNFYRSMRSREENEEKAWQALITKANHTNNPSNEWWKGLVIEFADGQIILESFKMTYTYKGLLEGSMAYASMGYWYDAQQKYSGDGHLLLMPTLEQVWTKPHEWCLPNYKVEIELVDGNNRLWLCWFTSNVPQTSLADFINAQTRNIDFSVHCMEYIDD